MVIAIAKYTSAERLMIAHLALWLTTHAFYYHIQIESSNSILRWHPRPRHVTSCQNYVKSTHHPFYFTYRALRPSFAFTYTHLVHLAHRAESRYIPRRTDSPFLNHHIPGIPRSPTRRNRTLTFIPPPGDFHQGRPRNGSQLATPPPLPPPFFKFFFLNPIRYTYIR
jgi:hypothetical protein